MQGILLCSQSLPRAFRAMLCCDIPCLAVPCYVELYHAALHHNCTTWWWALPEAGRGASQDIWQERPDPASTGEAPARAWAPVVLPRSSSARGMIDLLSASGGLSQCQASAQTGALKGESPFPLWQAEQQSPRRHPLLRFRILSTIGPVATSSCPALGSAQRAAGSAQASGVPALPG